MTPDEIRVAIRMLGQRVAWKHRYQVIYDPEHGYVLDIWGVRPQRIFDETGKFRDGGWLNKFHEKDFQTFENAFSRPKAVRK